MWLDKERMKAQLKMVVQKKVHYDGCGNFVVDDEVQTKMWDVVSVWAMKKKMRQPLLLTRPQVADSVV